jgi:hypothetical protein
MEARLERDGLSSFGDWPLHIYNEQVYADRTLLGLVRKRVLRLLVRRGLLCQEAGESLNEPEAPPLHALYAASVRCPHHALDRYSPNSPSSGSPLRPRRARPCTSTPRTGRSLGLLTALPSEVEPSDPCILRPRSRTIRSSRVRPRAWTAFGCRSFSPLLACCVYMPA